MPVVLIFYCCSTAALWSGEQGGKLAVIGSVAMFDDKWLDVEDNAKIMDWLFRWLKPVLPHLPATSHNACGLHFVQEVFHKWQHLLLSQH